MTRTGYPGDFLCPYCHTNDWAVTDEFIPADLVQRPLWKTLVVPFALIMLVYLLLIIAIGSYFGIFEIAP